jgi:hypothetical protein
MRRGWLYGGVIILGATLKFGKMEKWKNGKMEKYHNCTCESHVDGGQKLLVTGHKKNGKMEKWLTINPS